MDADKRPRIQYALVQSYKLYTLFVHKSDGSREKNPFPLIKNYVRHMANFAHNAIAAGILRLACSNRSTTPGETDELEVKITLARG